MAGNFDVNEILLADDITELTIKDEKDVLDILQERLSLGFQYTRIGEDMLIVMKSLASSKSPAVDASTYDKNFGQKLRESLSAAVSFVNKVLTSMNEDILPLSSNNSHIKSKNQSIIFLGNQYSGKSEVLVRILAFFKTASLVLSNRKANASALVGELVIKACQIAEVFGHARNLKNRNISRVAKYIKIYHATEEKSLQLLSWTIDVFPFDRCKVYGPHQRRAMDIGNFQILYQVAIGLSTVNKPLASKLKIFTANQFQILCRDKSDTELEMVNDVSNLTTLLQTFRLLGFNDVDLTKIFTVIAIILHLGNISAVCNFNDDKKDRIKLVYSNELLEQTMTLEEISSNLGISYAEFESILIRWPLADGQPLYAMFESTIIMEIKMRIHKVMEYLYWQLFSWIIKCLNQRFHENIMDPSEDETGLRYVSFMDLPGFEDNYPYNSLETLFVNYANEKLFMHCKHFIELKCEELLSSRDSQRIDQTANHSNDMNNVLDLLTRDKVGVFPVLNKFSRMQAAAGCSDDLSMLLSQRHPQGIDILTSTQHKHISHGFRIMHYNESAVCYDVDGFIEKNRIGHDCIRGLDHLFASSSESFIRLLSALDHIGSPISPRVTSITMVPKQVKGKVATTSDTLTSQLNTILHDLSVNHNRFIVCLDSLSSPSNVQIASSITPNIASPINAGRSKQNGFSNSPKKLFDRRSDLRLDGSMNAQYDAILAQLRSYHIPLQIQFCRLKYPIILPYKKFYNLVEVFGRIKGWNSSSSRMTAELLSHRSSILADSLLPKTSYQCGKIAIMFISTDYETSIQQQLKDLLYTKCKLIQANYRSYKLYRVYLQIRRAIIKIQTFFRRCLWRKVTLRVLAVRRERRLAALRQQQHEKERQERIRREQEHFELMELKQRLEEEQRELEQERLRERERETLAIQEKERQERLRREREQMEFNALKKRLEEEQAELEKEKIREAVRDLRAHPDDIQEYLDDGEAFPSMEDIYEDYDSQSYVVDTPQSPSRKTPLESNFVEGHEEEVDEDELWRQQQQKFLEEHNMLTPPSKRDRDNTEKKSSASKQRNPSSSQATVKKASPLSNPASEDSSNSPGANRKTSPIASNNKDKGHANGITRGVSFQTETRKSPVRSVSPAPLVGKDKQALVALKLTPQSNAVSFTSPSKPQTASKMPTSKISHQQSPTRITPIAKPKKEPSSRTASWIDDNPASSSDDVYMETIDPSSYDEEEEFDDTADYPELSYEQLSQYKSFSSKFIDDGDTEITPVIINKRLRAYHTLTTKLISVWRQFYLSSLLEKLYDAICRRKVNALVEALQNHKRIYPKEDMNLPYIRNAYEYFRNLYHIAVSVGSIDCINVLGLSILDVILRDSAQNNWLHIMAEAPNVDFLRRLHTFIQRYEQAIRASQPLRVQAASILNIISAPMALQTGSLQKLSSGDKFQKRYVVLTINKLMYYNSEKDFQNNPKTPSDTLLVAIDQTVIRHSFDSDLTFILDSLADLVSSKGKRRFVFKASSKEEYYLWLRALSQVTTIVTTKDPSTTTNPISVNIINNQISRIWVTEVNSNGDTPLHRLAQNTIVKHDDTVNHVSYATAASEFDDLYQLISVAAWLIDNGCPIDVCNREGYTAFDLALQNQSYDLAAYFYRLGCASSHVKKKVLDELISRDTFKGITYKSMDSQHLPQPEKWYGYTYLSINIQEIHLKSSNGRSQANMSSSFIRK